MAGALPAIAGAAERPARTPGAYIAWHPWLATIAGANNVPLIIKAGHSGRLGDRLTDSAYTTCWSKGWRYLATFEVATKEEAEQIETGFLHTFSNYRIDGRELVVSTTTDVSKLEQVLVAVAEALHIPGALVQAPTYATSPGDFVPKSDAQGPISAELTASQLAISKLPVLALDFVPKSPAPDSGTESPAQDSGEDDLAKLDFALGGADFGTKSPATVLPAPLEERKYQVDAAEACVSELQRLGKTTLLMACRCGKTRVAHMIMQSVADLTPRPKVFLFLVPWLALIEQTVDKLCSYGTPRDQVVMVGSRKTADRATRMTTSPEEVAAWLISFRNRERVISERVISERVISERVISERVISERNREHLLVVSTYHSSHVAIQAAHAAGVAYDLTVFDECHHVCGGRELRPSNFVLLGTPPEVTGPRLFMTATPVYRGVAVNMSEHELFGGVAYRYHLRQGIKAGYVNDFEIQLVASSKDAIARLDRLRATPETQEGQQEQSLWARFLQHISGLFGADKVAGELGTSNPLESYCQERVLAAQVALAFEHLTMPAGPTGRDSQAAPDSVPTAGRNKLLVFCRTIAGAEKLRDEVAGLFKIIGDARGRPVEVPLLVASSRTPREELVSTLGAFADPDRPGILFNCKLFQEGIEFPPLNGVFFATPRHSSRDIIQSMCRALTRMVRVDPAGQQKTKPASVIYIPVPPNMPAASGSAIEGALGRFETLLPFAEAIYSEDPRFYEHLLDPAKPYPIGWLGAYGTAERLLQAARRAIRYGTKGASKTGRLQDRLTKNDRIPWDVAFGELRRIVVDCRRYPKGNDGFRFSQAREIRPDGTAGEPKILNFGAWYDWARREYSRFVGGEASALQPHQVRDLESLQDWRTRGVDGPYPPQECIDALAAMLEESQGVMPPILVTCGGWIGLDATPLERLSGFLTTISQSDGRARSATQENRGFCISSEKARMLDAAFGKWGLRWRKDRWYPDEELDAVLAKWRAGGVPGGCAATREGAASWLAVNGRPGILHCSTTKTGKAKDYSGRKTVIQLAHEQFVAMAKRDPKDPYIQRGWPGYPEKHSRMELPEVWKKGLAPPRFGKGGKLILRQPPERT